MMCILCCCLVELQEQNTSQACSTGWNCSDGACSLEGWLLLLVCCRDSNPVSQTLDRNMFTLAGSLIADQLSAQNYAFLWTQKERALPPSKAGCWKNTSNVKINVECWDTARKGQCLVSTLFCLDEIWWMDSQTIERTVVPCAEVPCWVAMRRSRL